MSKKFGMRLINLNRMARKRLRLLSLVFATAGLLVLVIVLFPSKRECPNTLERDLGYSLIPGLALY